jgi:hypothetical protein
MKPISTFAVFNTLKNFPITEDHCMHNIKDKLIAVDLSASYTFFTKNFVRVYLIRHTRNKIIFIL